MHVETKVPTLRRVDWLAEVLDLNLHQTYKAIAEKAVPPGCVIRIGKRIRIKEEAVIRWLNQGEAARESEP